MVLTNIRIAQCRTSKQSISLVELTSPPNGSRTLFGSASSAISSRRGLQGRT